MPVQTERRIRLPPDARSPGRARRLVAAALADPGYDDIVDTAVLLASELAENAVLHAGTEFEVAVEVGDADVVITVADRGAGPLEAHLAQPRRRYGRAATHGRGLAMLARLATSWGTRHDADGTHHTWFRLAHGPVAAPPDRPAATPEPEPGPAVGRRDRTRWLLHLPAGLVDRLGPEELVAELVRRLREVLDAASVLVDVDDGDGTGVREIARAGAPEPTGELTVALPTTAPLRGALRVTGVPAGTDAREPAELVAHRIAMAIESAWLRGVDQRRRAWMTYLAETSELLSQSLDVELAVAVVPQVVVPRLGLWCAVHLADPLGRLRLAALTHADEDVLPELRAALDPTTAPELGGHDPGRELRERLAEVVRGSAGTVRFALPTEGIAIALRARGRTLGTLSVGRPDTRPHTPEDVVLIDDIARRAGMAIHNAQSTAAQVDVSQALQQALLPRALPIAPGLDLAARYLPATAGSDVGGDFYDVLTIDASRWLVSIGDVCGKGARAAARTGTVRDVLRVLVRDGRPLPRAVELLNDVMMEAEDPTQFCTLAAALISRPGPGEPPGLVADLVLAGHLQPVLVRRDGSAELVGEFGTAVGLVPRMDLVATRHLIGPGDALLVYTDGVTERRRGGHGRPGSRRGPASREQFGPDRLLDAASAAAGRPAAQLVEAVRSAVERFSADPRDDDIALLAVRAAPEHRRG